MKHPTMLKYRKKVAQQGKRNHKAWKRRMRALAKKENR
jgi:hypothetical protein